MFLHSNFRLFFLIFFVMLFFTCSKKNHSREILVDGLETIIEEKMYVMHSMIYADDAPWTTSNIFVIRGTGDTVWIYGSGYGDFNEPCEEACNDNNYYLGMEFYGTGPATEDVKPIDSIITQVFNLSKDSVILQFIVPHYHNDHINSEFINAFYSHFNYPQKENEKIWIHMNDSLGALCNEPCCGTEPCPDKKNKYYGVPFHPTWKQEYKNMFVSMGNADDVCNEVIKTFTSAVGKWKITKAMSLEDEGHTDGTVNLQNETLQWEISGTKSKIQCDIPESWKRVSVHGNINLR